MRATDRMALMLEMRRVAMASLRAAKPARRNGLDLDLLEVAVGGLRAHPEAGTVTIRTRHHWADGGPWPLPTLEVP
jgi:hypothetical protein